MTICKYCGHEIPSGQDFCNYCGPGIKGLESIQSADKLPPMGPVYASPGRMKRGSNNKLSKLLDVLKNRIGK